MFREKTIQCVDEIEKGDVVVVKWHDSATHGHTWDDPSGDHVFAVIETCGFVLQADDAGITVTQSMVFAGAGIDEVSNNMSIPAGCIMEIRKR